ncbi:MAG TPA: DNA polymerase III subunit delta [Candidatus Adamsella sp.]|nr:DNA polymerase III subunit delta [Candidatus Adamsella sp.]
MPVYLYWGEEDFNIDKAVRNLRENILDDSLAGLNHKILKPNKLDIKSILEELQAVPMMFGNFLLEIYTPDLFLRGTNKPSSSDKIMQSLFDTLENLVPNFHALFVCKIPRGANKKIDSSSKLVKLIQSTGEVREFPMLKSYQTDKLISWINQTCKEKEIKINKDAAEELLFLKGDELRLLDNELDKLKLLVYPNTSITKKDVLSFSGNNENVFFFADCILKNDRKSTLSELRKLTQKEHPLKILAVLQSVIKRWLRIKIESMQKKSPQEISKIVNLHEFVVKQDMEKLKKVNLNYLVAIREALTDIEYNIKSGKLSDEIAFDMILATQEQYV